MPSKYKALARLAFSNALVALIYATLGILSKLLLVYDGPASSFWPASGFANGICIVYGYSFLPAVFFGTFLSFSYSPQDGFMPSLALGLPIAAASMLQAGLILWISRRLDYAESLPKSRWSLVRLILLLGPFGNWISACAYGIVGLINDKSLSFYSVLSWWLGDSTGSISVSFIVIIMATRSSRNEWVAIRPYSLRYLFGVAALPLISSILGNYLITSSFSSELHSRVEIGYQYKLLLGLNELLFVMVAAGFVIQSSIELIEQDHALKRSQLASHAAAAVVHEISHPLIALDLHLDNARRHLGNADILETGHKLTKLTDCIDQCKRDVIRLSKISKTINELVCSSMTESQNSLVGAALYSSINMCRELLCKYDCSLAIPECNLNYVVACGKIKLEVSLRNILANAIFAAGDQGVVRVAIRKHYSDIEIIVEDSGPGFDKRILGIGNDQIPSNKGGMGLGLVIVRLAIEGSGGSLRIGSSQSIGGASVAIRLPLVYS